MTRFHPFKVLFLIYSVTSVVRVNPAAALAEEIAADLRQNQFGLKDTLIWSPYGPKANEGKATTIVLFPVIPRRGWECEETYDIATIA
jgi:hypothetical protein